MSDGEKVDEGQGRDDAPRKPQRVRVINVKRIGKVFIKADLSLKPGESAMVTNKVANYLIEKGVCKIVSTD